MTALAKSTNLELVYTGGVAADWLTLTTWNYRQWYGLSEMLIKALGITQRKLTAKLQYQGSRVSCESGGIFAGIGQQMGRTHCIIEISGGAAHQALEMIIAASEQIDIDEWRCTRIDLQRTLDSGVYTADHAQELHERVRISGHTAGFVSSHDRHHGELATVYIGSQKSGRFMRVYQKVVGGVVMLRAEVVFRYAGGSDTMFRRAMHDNSFTMEMAYAGAIDAVSDSFLSDRFAPAAIPELPQATRVESKTVSWIIKVVIPVIRRVISQHDAQSHLVAMELMSMIRQCSPPDWWEGDVR